jgi:hypothetical protein
MYIFAVRGSLALADLVLALRALPTPQAFFALERPKTLALANHATCL